MRTKESHAEEMRLRRATLPESERRERSRRQAAAYRASHAKIRPFVGVDGEGGNIGGNHLYLLLRAGEHSVESDTGLKPLDCLRFLSELPSGPIYISYYFDYDVTMMLKGLPSGRLRRLLDREGRLTAKDGTKLNQALPVEIGEYQIDYLPRKFFQVRRKGGKWVVINDISSFFQCSFVKALTDWQITDSDTLADIQRGKDDRSNFGALTDSTRRYNASECVLLASLGESFRAVCVEAGYVPAKWQGPGYLAVAMFRKHGIPKTRELPPIHTDVWQAANAAYYGGRFEVTGVGPIPGPIYQYDINSAYPDAIRQLPCLMHAQWFQGEHPDAKFVLQYGRFEAKESSMLYAFPIRDKDGGIYFPAYGNGWYWQHEIRAARHQRFIVRRSLSLVSKCGCQPFDWIDEIYAERQRLGKAARGKVLKLGLNSLYGKTAQSIGGAPYANPVYASLITSLTRVKLAEAYHSTSACKAGFCGRNVFMLATDAVFVSERLGLPTSKSLGEWDLEVHTGGMFIIQPGVYFTIGETHNPPKTRGLPQRAVDAHREQFENAYYDLVNAGNAVPVSVPLTCFIGLRQGLARNKPETVGTWVSVDKQVSYNWQTKRAPECLPLESFGALRPLPLSGSTDLESVPYSKEIGRFMELQRLEFWDQPDFGSDFFLEGD
jgi:hypothetical protein